MPALEFTAELSGSDTLTIPPEVIRQLPEQGKTRIIVRVIFFHEEASDADKEWRAATYEQFLADDSPEDSVYDELR